MKAVFTILLCSLSLLENSDRLDNVRIVIFLNYKNAKKVITICKLVCTCEHQFPHHPGGMMHGVVTRFMAGFTRRMIMQFSVSYLTYLVADSIVC